jgi:hypothetical protein
MVLSVISRTDSSDATRRLSDLRRAQPGDATLRNLLGILNAKLELCANLPVFEWEASSEGWPERASALRELAEAERRSCSAVLDELRAHLEQRAALPGRVA